MQTLIAPLQYLGILGLSPDLFPDIPLDEGGGGLHNPWSTSQPGDRSLLSYVVAVNIGLRWNGPRVWVVRLSRKT